MLECLAENYLSQSVLTYAYLNTYISVIVYLKIEVMRQFYLIVKIL